MTDGFLGYSTLYEALEDKAALSPDRDALVFIGDDDSVSRVSYSSLLEKSRNFGGHLLENGVGPGEIAMLLLPHSLELIYGFLGGLSSGVVTTIYPYPAFSSDQSKSCGLISKALRDIGAKALVTSPGLHEEFSGSGCAVFSSGAGLPELVAPAEPVYTTADLDPEIAYLQLTSGTTGSSKGVLLTHRNILCFVESSIARKPWPYRRRLNWIPLYHTGALMGALVTSLLAGMTLVLMSPARWLVRPLSVFKALEKYRIEKTTLPNSGFVHAWKYVDDREVENLDLSCLKSLLTAGEPAGASIIEKFYDKFSRAGLKRSSFSNAYGQAEATALISQSFTDDQITVDRIDADPFYSEGEARRVSAGFKGKTLSVVSCGRPVWGIRLKIVDDQGRELPERRSGEILVQGEVVFAGYHRTPELTAATLRDGWLHTGDMGYIAGGELYVCDRKKDLIITGGKNVRPGDIEGLVYSGFGGCRLAAALGIYDDEIGTEKVVLVCEWNRPPGPGEAIEIEKRARKLLYSGLSIGLDDFRIVEPGWIIRTTTRKISRKKTGDKYSLEFGL